MSRWARARESFWWAPAWLCLGAVVLAEGMIEVDRRVGAEALGPLSFLVSRVGVGGSRDLLGAIAGSLLTVAATTFSITIAVLALTSSTYGPRLVRNFMADRGNQYVLGVFVATFLYALLVLRSVGSAAGVGEQPFVPHLAVTLAVLLAVVAIAVLVYFIHHISDSVQIWTLARSVREDLVAAIDPLYPGQLGRDRADVRVAGPDADPAIGWTEGTATSLRAGDVGYVQTIRASLVEVAARHDVVISLRVRPGSHVHRGSTLALIGPATAVNDDLLDAARRAFPVGKARTPREDADFAVLQLEEMAVRALSPSLNDPYTANNALDDLSAAFVMLAQQDAPSVDRYGHDGNLRVWAPGAQLDDLVGRVVDAMRLYAIDHPSVLHRTLDLIQQIGVSGSTSGISEHLRTKVDNLVDAFERRSPQACDLTSLQEHADEVIRRLRETASRSG